MNKTRELTKNTIILGIGQFVPKVFAMITLPILTGAFSTSSYGQYDLISSFTALFLPISTLLIQQAAFRFLLESNTDKERKNYISTSVVFVFSLSMILALIVIIGGFLFGLDIGLVFSALALYVAEAVLDLFGQIARGLGSNEWYSLSAIVCSVIYMILIGFIVAFGLVNVYVALLVGAVAYIGSAVILAFRLKMFKYMRLKYFTWQCLKKMLRYSVPIIPSSISLWVVNLSDRIIVTWRLGSAFNGIYAAACKIPNVFGAMYGVFNLAWTELAARSIKEKNVSRYYSKLFDGLYTFMVGALLMIVPISSMLYDSLVDSKFIEGYAQLFILYVGIILSCLVAFYGGLYVALKKTKQVGISSLVGAVLNIIFNIFMIDSIGLYAASVSTVVSFLAICIYRAVQIRRYIALEYSLKNISVGVAFIGVAGWVFYMDNGVMNVFLATLAIVYNFKYNMVLIQVWHKINNIRLKLR
ncbi:MAG: oligosaccharide flippase family protein [Candidatus Saccharibacteria bacterium]|nr:oligosaccharide flippase family protein [Candidatus Saccharibacteria bacterium]